MTRYYEVLGDVFAFVYMLMLSTAIYFLFASINSTAILAKSGTSVFYQFIWFFLYFVLICQIYLIRRSILQTILRCKLPILLIILGSIGYVNGVHPESVQFLAMYTFTMLFAIWVATYFSPQKLFDMFFMLGKVVLIEYWAIYPIYSKYSLLYDKIQRTSLIGLTPYAGTFGHKNLAGGFFAVCTIIGVMKLLDRSQKRSFLDVLFLGAMVVSLMATGAVNPFLCTVVVLMFIPFVRLLKKNWALAGLYVSVALTVGVGILLSADTVLGLFGRDLGFTGRSFLVEAWPVFFFRHPLFGYGFGEFFANSPSSGAAELQSISPAWHTFINFESSYLQIGIDFGAAGMLVVSLMLIKNVLTGFRIMQSSSDPMLALPFLLTLYLIFSSFSDVYLVLHNCYISFLFFHIYAIGRREKVEGTVLAGPSTTGFITAAGLTSADRYV